MNNSYFNNIINNLTEYQKESLEKISKNINLSKLTPQEAKKIIEDLNINIKGEKRQVIKKIKPNEKCICQSGKKYKKCCYLN
jgi:hypothetical protein